MKRINIILAHDIILFIHVSRGRIHIGHICADMIILTGNGIPDTVYLVIGELHSVKENNIYYIVIYSKEKKKNYFIASYDRRWEEKSKSYTIIRSIW